MNASSIAFVGGGNMAGSLVGGLLARGWRATSIRVSDPEEASLARLAHLGVATFSDNAAAVSGGFVAAERGSRSTASALLRSIARPRHSG